jgi:hypothetical protein
MTHYTLMHSVFELVLGLISVMLILLFGYEVLIVIVFAVLSIGNVYWHKYNLWSDRQ